MSELLKKMVTNKVDETRARKILKKFRFAELIGIGRHSVVLKEGELAIKVQKDVPAAKTAIADEAKWLRFFNRHGIGPQIVEHDETLHYVTYHYVFGDFITDFISRCDDGEVMKKVILKCFEKCHKMDELMVNKKEMHKPLKHILIGYDVKFIDFERCYETKRPKNVTQLCDFFFISNAPVAEKTRKMFGIKKEDALTAVKSYKQKPDLDKIKELLDS